MFPINVVERETGVTKYLLRMWERRYSFPRPARDSKGERLYSLADVEKLKLVRALMQSGYRPSRIMDQHVTHLQLLQKTFEEKNNQDEKLVLDVVILITEPSLETQVRMALRDHKVKKVLVLSNSEQIEKMKI